MAYSKNVTRKVGTTYPLGVTILDDEIKKTAMNLSTASNFVLRVGTKPTARTTSKNVFSATGAHETDGSDGKLLFTISAANADQKPGEYVAEVWFEISGEAYATKTFAFEFEAAIPE